MRSMLLVLSLLVAVACKKPEIEECRKACWNYNKIMFWAETDEMVKDKSPQEAARIRAERELAYSKIQLREEDPGLLNCITNCQHNSNSETIACMQTAETRTTIESCLEK